MRLHRHSKVCRLAGVGDNVTVSADRAELGWLQPGATATAKFTAKVKDTFTGDKVPLALSFEEAFSAPAAFDLALTIDTPMNGLPVIVLVSPMPNLTTDRERIELQSKFRGVTVSDTFLARLSQGEGRSSCPPRGRPS